MKAKIHITLKNGVLDPQGKAIETALDHMGFAGVRGVRVGKYIEVDMDASNAEKSRASIELMCEKLLTNTVVENYQIDIAS